MRRKRFGVGALALAAALAVAACGSSSTSSSASSSSGGAASGSSGGNVSATVNGAGSTLAAPIYQQWANTLKSNGLTVNYNPVGSGAGVTDLASATVAL